MRTFEHNGRTIRVWSMSLMGWRYHVDLPGGETHAGTKRTERAAVLAAKKVAERTEVSHV